VPDCVLILNDAPVRAVAPRAGEPWRRLPALEFLLARARSTPLPAGGWRTWLWSRQGGRPTGDAGFAGLAAASLGLPDGCYWLATPVHLVAGLDTVRLHPTGMLTLDDAHAAQLAADFARVFSGSGWQLHATGARDLLLSAPVALDAASDDPADWLGEDPRAGLPRGPDARALRTLATEIEMWLYGHAVNSARYAAGLPAVSGLWLWAGGVSRAPDTAASGRLIGDDLVARALWGGTLSPSTTTALPVGWTALRAALPQGERDVWHLLLGFNALEDAWLAPLLLDWRAGRVRQIELVAGRRHYVLPAAARWRFWSRRRPWWEGLKP
jgi:hypothetical protein